MWILNFRQRKTLFSTQSSVALFLLLLRMLCCFLKFLVFVSLWKRRRRRRRRLVLKTLTCEPSAVCCHHFSTWLCIHNDGLSKCNDSTDVVDGPLGARFCLKQDVWCSAPEKAMTTMTENWWLNCCEIEQASKSLLDLTRPLDRRRINTSFSLSLSVDVIQLSSLS